MASNIATCLFLNQPKSTKEKTCSIAYGVPSETCTLLSHQSSKSSSDKVYVGFPESNHLLAQEESCCFVATASNGTHTVSVEGSMFTAGIYNNMIVILFLSLYHINTNMVHMCAGEYLDGFP
jgi:hypothetical protein